MFFITAIFIANRKVTSGYNIKKIPALKGNNSCKVYNFRIKVGNVKQKKCNLT